MKKTTDSFPTNPIKLFEQWYSDAEHCKQIRLAESMCLATTGIDGYPDGRMVLLKNFGNDGFVFYTNMKSPKGEAIRKNPVAALIFYWDPIRKQVRIVGNVSAVSDIEADTYFHSRPRQSQIGAWASLQSQPLASNDILQERFVEYKIKFEGKQVPRPPHWSGYRVKPQRIEFWVEKPHRLHDRFVYTITASGNWQCMRLYP